MNNRIEELYLEAEADIRNNNYHEAFQKHENILYEEPTYAPSHNSLGWIYKTQLDNYEKAENHFIAAIKSDPQYPHPYFHLASLYIDIEKFNELARHLEKCLQVNTVDKGWIYYRYGMMDELKANYAHAIRHYKKAILNSLSNEKIKDYQADIERCQTKQEILEEGKEVKENQG